MTMLTITETETAVAEIKKSERGMTLFAVMAIMAIFAIGLLAVAPTVQQEIQREKELEAIQRGEEVAEAIRQYVEFYRGAKLPNSMDDLLDGLPQGTKKRAILRASAAIDPLSEDGHWRLIKADVNSLDSLVILNSLNTETDSDIEGADDDFDVVTDNTPFIGVASQSKSKSVIAYYGIENQSKWIFTPLFRGTRNNVITVRPRPAGRGRGIIID